LRSCHGGTLAFIAGISTSADFRPAPRERTSLYCPHVHQERHQGWGLDRKRPERLKKAQAEPMKEG